VVIESVPVFRQLFDDENEVLASITTFTGYDQEGDTCIVSVEMTTVSSKILYK